MLIVHTFYVINPADNFQTETFYFWRPNLFDNVSCSPRNLQSGQLVDNDLKIFLSLTIWLSDGLIWIFTTIIGK